MARFPIRLDHEGDKWYLIWSTIVDAPVTYGLTWHELVRYVRRAQGTEGVSELFNHKGGLDELGVPHDGYGTLKTILASNRAGPYEKRLTKLELIEQYCIQPDKSEEGKPEVTLHLSVPAAKKLRTLLKSLSSVTSNTKVAALLDLIVASIYEQLKE